MHSPTSRLWLGAQLTAVLLAAVAIGLLLVSVGLNPGVTALLAGGLGTALVARHMGARRWAGASALSGGQLTSYPVTLPADRQSVGGVLQTKRNTHAAPGVLGVRAGHAEFFPAKPEHAHLGWEGPTRVVQLRSFFGHGTVLRVHTPHGTAQFASTVKKPDVLKAIEDLVLVSEGWERPH